MYVSVEMSSQFPVVVLYATKTKNDDLNEWNVYASQMVMVATERDNNNKKRNRWKMERNKEDETRMKEKRREKKTNTKRETNKKSNKNIEYKAKKWASACIYV